VNYCGPKVITLPPAYGFTPFVFFSKAQSLVKPPARLQYELKKRRAPWWQQIFRAVYLR
jgi:hypothetical protein